MIYDGREWRIHYWVLDADKIVELANAQRSEENKPKEEADVYKNGDIPDEVWRREGA